jgi:hypothetical protein
MLGGEREVAGEVLFLIYGEILHHGMTRPKTSGS